MCFLWLLWISDICPLDRTGWTLCRLPPRPLSASSAQSHASQATWEISGSCRNQFSSIPNEWIWLAIHSPLHVLMDICSTANQIGFLVLLDFGSFLSSPTLKAIIYIEQWLAVARSLRAAAASIRRHNLTLAVKSGSEGESSPNDSNDLVSG